MGKENSEKNYTMGKIIQKERLLDGISALNGTEYLRRKGGGGERKINKLLKMRHMTKQIVKTL